MTVKLSSLRVTAEMDVSQYVRAAAAKTAADKGIVASSREVGAALAAQDIAASKLGAGVVGLSRSFIGGYSEAEKFEKAVRAIGRALDQGMDPGRAAAALDGVYRKFGRVADAVALNEQKFVGIVPIVSSLNAQYEVMATVQERAARSAQNLATAQSMQRGINERLGIGRAPIDREQVAAAFQQSFARDDAALAARSRSIIATHLPEQAEMERHKAYLTEIVDLGAKRFLTEKQIEEAQRVEAARHDQAINSIRGMYVMQGKYASGVGLARHEVVNLGRQLQDVVVTLQAGQPLSTILLQQGSQIADIFATSRANFAGFAAQAGGWAKTFLLSTTGIVTGVALVGATAAYAGLKYADAQREIERSLSGVGRASGISVSQINAMAEATANAKSISVASAREIATAFASVGRIGGGMTGDLTGVTKDYAAQTGQDLTAAAQELAKAFADPVRGADMLNEKLGFLDARTRSYIRALADQNDRTGAQRALLDAMSGSIANASDRVSWLTRAWVGLKNVVSDSIDAIGNAVAGQITLEERLTKIIQVRTNLAEGWTARSPRAQAAISVLDQQITDLQEEIRRNSARQSSLTSNSQSAHESLRIQDLADATQKWTTDLRTLKAELKAIDDALANQNMASRFADSAQIQRVAEAYRNAQASFLSPEEKLRQESDLILKSIMARTLAEQQAVVAARESLSLSGQKITTTERELQIANRILEVNANAAREAREVLRQATNTNAAAGQRPFQRGLIEIEQRYRDLQDRLTNGQAPSTGGGQSSFHGLQQNFADAIQKMMADIPGITVSSGLRTIQRQQELWEDALKKYGTPEAARKWVAPPGSSLHNSGSAADLRFATPEARTAAHASASRYGLAFPLQNEPWHIEPMGARGGMAGGINATADLAKAKAAEISSLFKDQVSGALRAANDDIKRQTEMLGLQENAVKRTAYEIGRYAKEQELTNSFQQQGVPKSAELTKEIDRLADAAGRLAERQASVRLTQDVMFEREQIFRTQGEAAIASRLRGTGIGMESEIADQMRFNQTLETTKSIAGEAMKGFLSDLRQGKNATDSLTNALGRVGDRLFDLATDRMITQLFSGLFGGKDGGGLLSMLFSARGNVFGPDGVQAFADGGVVYGPRMFKFAGGAGLMGEAGPEAIMPLKRDPLGRLGVVSAGASNDNGGKGGGANVIVNIVNNSDAKATQKRRSDGEGTEIIDIVIQKVGESMSMPGGQLNKVLSTMGTRNPMVSR